MGSVIRKEKGVNGGMKRQEERLFRKEGFSFNVSEKEIKRIVREAKKKALQR